MTSTSVSGNCPVSGTKGKPVDQATIKSMLAISLIHVQDADYYFCREPDCDVVYFSGNGQQVFRKEDVRERVFQKEPKREDIPVCYCFLHTPASVRGEIASSGKSTVIESINAGIKAGQCACDWRNPQGDCCLGNVSRLVKRYNSDYGIRD